MSGRNLMLKIARPIYRLVRPFLPSIRRYYNTYQNYKLAGIYHSAAITIKDFCFVEKDISFKPLISVIVPVYNPDTTQFLEMVYSVVNQHYEHWELILVNASTNHKSRKLTESCALIDTHIKIVNAETNEGISANTNLGLKEASGEYVALLDHDDILHPCALHSVVEYLQGDPKADLLYTDEDKISATGDRFLLPHYKPDWSPDLLRNVNYITHFAVIRKSLMNKLGGLRPKCDGAQDYDLMLRIADRDPVVKHVPRILYHWRTAQGSTADLISNKQYIFKAGQKALKDHLRRNGIRGKVISIEGKPGYYEILYPTTGYSIVIGPVSPSKYGACADWLKKLFQSLGDDNPKELIIGEWYKHIDDEDKLESVDIKYVKTKGDYWRNAADLASKEVAVCFKIAALPTDKKTIEKLAAAAAAQEHLAVSPVIVNKSNIILNSGIIMANGVETKLFEGYLYGRNTFFGDTDWVRNVSNLSTNLIALKSGLFKSLLDNAEKSYGSVPNAGDLIKKNSTQPNYIVWGHSAFKYLGPLKNTSFNQYHRVQQLRFVPNYTAHVDNWGERHEHDEA